MDAEGWRGKHFLIFDLLANIIGKNRPTVEEQKHLLVWRMRSIEKKIIWITLV